MPAEEEKNEAASVTESLYKQNLELAVKNKTLSLLRKLYEISVLALLPAELSEKLSSAIREDFSFERVSILLYTPETDVLAPLAHAESDRFTKARAADSTATRGLEHASAAPFFGPLIAAKEMQYTEDLAAVWGASLTPEGLATLATEGHVRSVLAYPLLINDAVRGAFTIHLNRTYADLTDYEKEAIQSLRDVIAVALDKALIYQELRDTNERQEGLIRFISHEVKGFLTKDMGAFAALDEGDFGELPAELKPFVERALAQTRDGVGSVMDILKASNLKKGTTSYQMGPFDLDALAKDVVEKSQVLAAAKNLALTYTSDPAGAPYTMNGDQKEIGDHVLRNLVENSINYTPTGSIAVSLKKENGKFVFAVKDTGIGITDEDKARLFTEGGHGKDSQKVNVHSTGYGLFIAKNIVLAHNGTIRAESEGAGKGSTFIAELPA
jgi:signal transduction histidine kinase